MVSKTNKKDKNSRIFKDTETAKREMEKQNRNKGENPAWN
jgi:hypothetical protein